MKTIEYTFVDKAAWPRGLWDDEPDKVQWQDQATGLPCLIVRNDSGALCGYVGVMKGHPCYARHYDDYSLTVHGGLTFSDFCSPHKKEHGICHIVEDGEDDHVWWLGFDCAHCSDVIPQFEAMGWRRDRSAEYRTLDFVKTECTRLALQLAAIVK